MREQAAAQTPVDDGTICELHRRIVLRSKPEIAGIYCRLPRRIAGSPVVFPNPAKVPALMDDLGAWLREAPGSPSAAFEGHFRLTAIHPFADGNGRTARLLMNLMLLRAGYPPIAVRPEDRKTYLDALARGSLADDLQSVPDFSARAAGRDAGRVSRRPARGPAAALKRRGQSLGSPCGGERWPGDGRLADVMC